MSAPQSSPESWVGPESSSGPAPGVEFAPHGARLVAYIIDSIIVGIAVLIIVVIGSVVFVSGSTVSDGQVTAIDAGAATALLLTILIAILITLLYFPFFWARSGQTPGMRPVGLHVVRDRDGSKISWGTAFLRLIGLWVASAVFYLGFIWIFVDKRRRGWQDLIAGTIVVKRP